MINENRKYLLLSLVMVCGLVLSSTESQKRSYLHKNARFVEPSPIVKRGDKVPISAHRAAILASKKLESKGVKDILVCEVKWIAAPLTGFLVDAKGDLRIGDERFRVFRIGLRDGMEEENGQWGAGEEFAFMAYGRTSGGKSIWFPKPGPGIVPTEKSTPEEMSSYLVYQFLAPENQKDFENLADRYR
jgi:hypothetical protein